MIIDCHGHYTTAPGALKRFRQMQMTSLQDAMSMPPATGPEISDDEIRESLEAGQLKMMKDRGQDVTLFSPLAGGMAHHVGDEHTSQRWTRVCNDLIFRVCSLFPDKFVGVCQLPQSPGIAPRNSVPELERCVLELGFVGCNLNPDPSGGHWSDPPLSDRWWYPLYEKLTELDVPAMIHVSSTCNPNFSHYTGTHYLNADTTAFMQLLQSKVFSDFPSLKIIIPHGGGAVPYHWGRYRGIAQDLGLPPLGQIFNNIYFDTCVYHQPGIELLARVIPAQNILFASEMIGAVRSIDPDTGRYFDDTRPYIETVPWLKDSERQLIFEDNARRIFSRLSDQLAKQRRSMAI